MLAVNFVPFTYLFGYFLVQLKWFDDPVVQCMRSIDVTDLKEVSLKRDFFSVLPQAVPQFPRVPTALLSRLRRWENPSSAWI